jgi:hypothetical protein
LLLSGSAQARVCRCTSAVLRLVLVPASVLFLDFQAASFWFCFGPGPAACVQSCQERAPGLPSLCRVGCVVNCLKGSIDLSVKGKFLYVKISIILESSDLKRVFLVLVVVS